METDDPIHTVCPIFQHQYVVARLNIEKTLALEYYVRASERTPDVIPLDSDEGLAILWQRIGQFLSEYGLPRDATDIKLACPRFVPAKHLVLVAGVYGSGSNGHRAEIYPVAVLPRNVDTSTIARLHGIEKSAYVALHPAVSLQPEYPVFGTIRPLLPQYALYQDVSWAHQCFIGSVTAGQRNCLDAEAVSNLNRLHLIAKSAMSTVHSSKDFTSIRNPECGCTDHPVHERDNKFSYATLGDIVYDFQSPTEADGLVSTVDRPAVFDVERSKVMQIINDWSVWSLSNSQ